MSSRRVHPAGPQEQDRIFVGGDQSGGLNIVGDGNTVTWGQVELRDLVAGYRAGVVATYFPRGGLLERDVELSCIAEFVDAEQDPNRRYWWWRAGMWAGKTALMAHVALYPPADTETVFFFISARSKTASTVDNFFDRVLPQLACLTGQPRLAMPTSTAQQHDLLHTLRDRAAEACRARGHRLLLVVDGLDEDLALAVQSVMGSIAAALPGVVPGNVRVLGCPVKFEEPRKDAVTTRMNRPCAGGR